MQKLEFHVTGEFIALNDLLKATGVVPSGGAGKAMVASRTVRVDGLVELRKTCKIRSGQVVRAGAIEITVRRAEPA